MKKSRQWMVILISLILLVITSTGLAAPKIGGLIQKAILLDTSNSMDGLINQAKSQLRNSGFGTPGQAGFE